MWGNIRNKGGVTNGLLLEFRGKSLLSTTRDHSLDGRPETFVQRPVAWFAAPGRELGDNHGDKPSRPGGIAQPALPCLVQEAGLDMHRSQVHLAGTMDSAGGEKSRQADPHIVDPCYKCFSRPLRGADSVRPAPETEAESSAVHWLGEATAAPS